MQFNSYIFILLFLPLTLVGYYTLNHLGKELLAKAYLLIMSLWFYGYFNASYLLIICASIAVNYLLSRLMLRCDGHGSGCAGGQGASGMKRALLILGIVFNVSLIFYFKYYNFFIENINIAFKTDFVLRNIVLPLGSSFFTFQQISFVVDSWKGETASYNFLEYALFVAFFPQLVAGPIVLHKELIPQFRDRARQKVDYDNLTRGIMLFTMGLAKKVLIADTFGNAVNWGFNQAAVFSTGEGALSTYEVLIVMLAYTFQIYFDFSGYSDMATGLGAMFNFVIPMNFNSPYKALSVSDFWKRWHMTLTRFLTNYVYIPLGGNRKGKTRTYINILLVFLISGIWHGANWTFILWGVIHGLGQCFNRLTHGIYEGICTGLGKNRVGGAIIRVVSWTVTFAFVNVAWLLFRADSVAQWLKLLKRLTVHYYYVRIELLDFFRIPGLAAALSTLGIEVSDRGLLTFCTCFLMLLALGICLLLKNNYEREHRRNALSLCYTAVMLSLCIFSLGSVSTFLYFNF